MTNDNGFPDTRTDAEVTADLILAQRALVKKYTAAGNEAEAAIWAGMVELYTRRLKEMGQLHLLDERGGSDA